MSDERNRFLKDVFEEGVELGIDYWAHIRDYSPANAQAKIRGGEGAPPDDWVLIDLNTISKGLEALKNGQAKMNKGLLGDALAADVLNDAGEVDAQIADCIIQVGLFGEIIYG